MITNILEYLVTDIYYQLWMVAHAADDSRHIFTREDWDEGLLAQFPDPADIPDCISMEPGSTHHLNSDGRFHLGRNAASMNFSEMVISWGEVSKSRTGRTLINISRKIGPARIIITNLRKWHHDGVLHRRRGDSLIVKSVTYIWGRNGVYGRDTGPYQVSLKQIRAKAHLGDVTDFRHTNIATTWSTSSGRRLPGSMVTDIIASNDIEVDFLNTDTVFKDATDEVIFLTEIAE